MNDSGSNREKSVSNNISETNKTTELWSSKKLFGQQREIQIEHLGEVYTLRMTRNGKLILTK